MSNAATAEDCTEQYITTTEYIGGKTTCSDDVVDEEKITHTWPIARGSKPCHGWKGVGADGRAFERSMKDLRCKSRDGGPNGIEFVYYEGNVNCVGEGVPKIILKEQGRSQCQSEFAVDLSCCSNVCVNQGLMSHSYKTAYEEKYFVGGAECTEAYKSGLEIALAPGSASGGATPDGLLLLAGAMASMLARRFW